LWKPAGRAHKSRVSTPTVTPSRLERGIAAILLAALVIGCLLVLRPFVAAILWGAILVYATWPVFTWIQRRLRIGRSAAALLMILAAFLVMVAPLALVVSDFADDVRDLLRNLRVVMSMNLPDPPEWVVQLPMVGPRVDEQWRKLSLEEQELQTLAAPYLEALGRWGWGKGVNIGIGLAQGTLELVLALFVAFFFYRDGARLAGRIEGGLMRLAGQRGQRLLHVAGNTVQAVVYGIVGTALVQAALMLVGLTIAGVPNAMLLAFLTGITSPLPVGPPIFWIGAAIWLYATAGLGWCLFMLAWGAGLVSMADNVVRPLLISRGGTTPIVLTLLGILGGVFAFGFLGLFLGPTLLALGYSLLQEWTSPEPAAAESRSAHGQT
jgi:predicted PurR-regulated permease PerM